MCRHPGGDVKTGDIVVLLDNQVTLRHQFFDVGSKKLLVDVDPLFREEEGTTLIAASIPVHQHPIFISTIGVEFTRDEMVARLGGSDDNIGAVGLEHHFGKTFAQLVVTCGRLDEFTREIVLRLRFGLLSPKHCR